MTNSPTKDSSYSGEITFIDHHYPALMDGSYEVTVTQTTNASNIDSDSITKKLLVTGPRFDLPVDLIHSHNPMRGSVLAQDGVIPTIAFNRNTLPWERSPGPGDVQDGASWLALLLVTEDEVKQGLAAESSTTLSAAESSLGVQKLEDWPLYDAYQGKAINLLHLDITLYDNILPKYGDLKWLSHCRQNKPDGASIEAELTYLLGNRLPTPGKLNTVYLVSLEHRYPDTQDDTAAAHIGTDLQSLVYLYKWQFTCNGQPDESDNFLQLLKKGGTFREILEKVETGLLQAPQAKTVSQPQAKQLLTSGRSVVPHQLRNGGQTYSWYKGPLSAVAESDIGLTFPAATADDLLLFDEATGMLDTTYAAAWSLGQMKCLENKMLSTDLFRWRHQKLHHQTAQNHSFDFSHLHVDPPVAASFPESVAEKIKGYTLLQGLPFENLVPLPELLPHESLRFFHLDPNWMRAFIDGFFSVAKVHGLDDWADEQTFFPAFDQPVTGVLLRSDAVVGWPNLHVNAYQAHQSDSDYDNTASVLPVLRKVFLAQDVMLLLFEGEPKTLDIYLSPEGLHSGFFPDTTPSDAPRYIHQIRNPCTGEDGIGTVQANMKVETISNEKGNKAYFTFSAVELANDFENSINTYSNNHSDKTPCITPEGTFTITPAYFGFELIEGAPLVRFQLDPTPEKRE